MALILDIGPLHAYLDLSDADHFERRELIEAAVQAIVMPAPVLVEADRWIHVRLNPGTGVLVALGRQSFGSFQSGNLHDTDYGSVRELCDLQAGADELLVDAPALVISAG